MTGHKIRKFLSQPQPWLLDIETVAPALFTDANQGKVKGKIHSITCRNGPEGA
jgi:hypothetical protein